MRKWYFNAESIIVAGQPNEAFWEVGERVQALGEQHGLGLRMPWGAHLTAGRFTAPGDEDTVQALRQALQNAPTLGVSSPISIDVGYYQVSKAGFVLEVVQSFK